MKISNFQFLISNFQKGFTFIDILVGVALMLVVFLGIFGAYQLGLKVVGQSKARIIATAIANQRIEMIRNLSYEAVGVQGRYPEGNIEETEPVSRNNIEYTINTRIDYIADPADGLAEDDPCPNDYKKVRVKVLWTGRFGGEVILVTDVAPKSVSQECEEIGGILEVSVFDAYGQQLSSPPWIEIVDPVADEVIITAEPDKITHRFVLPPSTYKVVVSKGGYSTEQTYGSGEIYNGQIIATPEKPNPIVFEGQLTEVSFSIDETSIFSVDTLSLRGTDYFSDSFLEENKISESSNIIVSEGEVNLIKTPGVYFADGTIDGDLCSFPGIDGDCAQSFTMVSQSKEIPQASLFIKKATLDPSDIYLEIRENSTIGNVIATSTLIDSSSLPINLEWTTFLLENPVTLAANTQYFLRLRSTPDSTDPEAGAQGSIYWGYLQATTSPPGYAGGKAFRYVGTAASEELAEYDFSFKIYENEYVPSGYLISTSTSPVSLLSWHEFSWLDLEPLNTDLRYQVYYASGTDWYLIPDADLPGNTGGLELSPVDLSGLATTTYSELKLRANFSTNDSNVSPTLDDWQVSWITSEVTPIPSVSFNLRGDKIIGTDADENPVYKYSQDHTSDSQGHIDISDLEWDSYTFSVDPGTGLDLIETDPSPQPIPLLPDNVTQSVILYLEAENSLLVTIQDIETSEPIFAATVRLYNTDLPYDTTQYTNEEGQTYFIPLEIATYTLEIEAPGYLATSATVGISGDETKTIKLERVE